MVPLGSKRSRRADSTVPSCVRMVVMKPHDRGRTARRRVERCDRVAASTEARMGLGFYAIDAIGREHRFKPIRGDALFVGRQTVYFTPSELAAHLRDHGISVDPTAIDIDRS